MGPHPGVAAALARADAATAETTGELAQVLEFPRPDGVCSTTSCTRPARMALGVARPVAGVCPDGQPTRPLGWHEVVHYDWRSAPSAAAARLFCKTCGLARLTLMVELYVCGDDAPEFDPAAPAADPNATMLANLTREI
jgi:hypothetical protein